MEASENEEGRVEAEGENLGAAKWAALKALEPGFPGIEAEDVEFEVLDEGDEASGRPARVVAQVDLGAWDEEPEDLPEEPVERVRALVGHVVAAIGLRGSVDVEETDEEIRAQVNGEDLGLLIGKHGATIDALQHLASRAAYRGSDDRKLVVLDAAGYRERRAGALERAADQAVSDAVKFGRAVELEPMSAYERRAVHTYLRDRAEVQTHSEGDEPERRLVVSPVGPS
ncbi:MAG: spoIIIJ-associated protein [Thermoleophilaceae bacterium]|jgi:spoIIIJ-associated protein|nr:spoIIIJ-associated protein [Thermoleophilaceae bacterium]